MIRIFVKHVPRLVRQHLPSVQTLDATAAVEALEDAASLKERDCHVDDFIKQCVSRVLALLPDLRVSGMIRALFAYKRAEVPTHPFVEEVATFLLEECGQGGLYVGFLDACTANDVLLLYNAFAVNDYLDVRLYTLCMGMLAAQTPHMLPSDCCVFFRSHVKYLKILEQCRLTGAGKPVPLNRILSPPLVIEVTLRFLEQDDATPDDLTTFIKWLVPMSHFYGISDQMADRVAKLHLALSQKPVIFSVDHIHHIIQSTCRVHRYIAQRDFSAARTLIESLLHEAERRSDVHTYASALATFHALDMVDIWQFDLVSGLLYTIINNLESAEDANRVRSIVSRRLEAAKSPTAEPPPTLIEFTIDRCPPAVAVLKLQDMVEKLEAHEQAATTRELGESGHKTAVHTPPESRNV